MNRSRRTHALCGASIGVLMLGYACGSKDETPDAGCAAPKQIIYTTPGCGAEAIPRCEVPNGDGCSMPVCLCDGVTTSGDGCGFSHEPFLYVGYCKKDAGPAVDVPNSTDGSRLDGHYFTIPDGRQLLEVPYCLPILPLTTGARYCPSTLAEAQTAVLDAHDGGSSDALPDFGGRPELSRPCIEPIVLYLPHGRSLGWGTSCYYDTSSGELLSILAGTDTPTECTGSPEPNTAAFVAEVYGQHVTCTWPGEADGG